MKKGEDYRQQQQIKNLKRFKKRKGTKPTSKGNAHVEEGESMNGDDEDDDEASYKIIPTKYQNDQILVFPRHMKSLPTASIHHLNLGLGKT